MTPRDLSLLRHLAEQMGWTVNDDGTIERNLSGDGGWSRTMILRLGSAWNPLMNANDTLKLIEKIDKPMALNREDSPDGPWWARFMHEWRGTRGSSSQNTATVNERTCMSMSCVD